MIENSVRPLEVVQRNKWIHVTNPRVILVSSF